VQSVEVAAKMADLLEVLLDYLVWRRHQELDKATQKRILEVSKFSEEEMQHVWAVIDAFIARAKIQSIL